MYCALNYYEYLINEIPYKYRKMQNKRKITETGIRVTRSTSA